MADIHAMAESGQSLIEPMRTGKQVVSWDDLRIKGAQLARIPLNQSESVNTTTVLSSPQEEVLPEARSKAPF